VKALAVARPSLTLFPRQMRFVKDQRRRPAAIGGIGSGKTFIGAAKVISRLDAPERGMIVAPTFDILRMATLDTLFGMLSDLGIEEGRDYDYNKNEKELSFRWGHRIVCRSAERYQNLRGPNLAYAWVDEGALIDGEAWKIIKGRVRVGRNPQTWLTTTPKGRNWIWEEWIRDAAGSELDPTHPIYRFSTRDNPELPADFVEGLGYEGRFAEQEIEGEFVAFEGLVYPAFSRSDHVTEVDCGGWGTVLAVDVGTRNPTAILTIRYAGDRIHIEREFYRRELGSTAIVASVALEDDRTSPDFVVVDPSAAGIIKDLEGLGIHARKAINDVVVGISRVTSALSALTIDPSCVNTIAEFESYQYPQGGKAERDAPIKANDHALDALRYAVMELQVPGWGSIDTTGLAEFLRQAGVG